MSVVPGNAQHIGGRKNQQDAFGFSQLEDESFTAHAGAMAVLADGMGGMKEGRAAARSAVSAFLQAYGDKTNDEPVDEALLRSVQAANKQVHALALEAGAPEDVGTTLVAAVVCGSVLHWIAAGDSAAFLFREASLVRLNNLHSYAAELDEKAARGEITVQQARQDPQREALTSYLGGPRVARLDRSLRPLPLLAGDRVLLASDGLFGTLEEDRIASILTQSGSGDDCRALVEAVIRAGHQDQDNVTVISLGLCGGPQGEAAMEAGFDEARTPQSKAPAEAGGPVSDESANTLKRLSPKPPFWRRPAALCGALLLAALSAGGSAYLWWASPSGDALSPRDPTADELLHESREGQVAPGSAPGVTKGDLTAPLPPVDPSAPPGEPLSPPPPQPPKQEPPPAQESERPSEPPPGSPGGQP